MKIFFQNSHRVTKIKRLVKIGIIKSRRGSSYVHNHKIILTCSDSYHYELVRTVSNVYMASNYNIENVLAISYLGVSLIMNAYNYLKR